MSTAAATAAAASPVDVLVEFFSTRLLQKRFRPGNRTEASPEIAACEAEFRAACQRAADAVADGKALDALEWLDMCSAFSEKWMEVCHWVSPKKFREHLTATIGAEWAREDEIPEERELPPIDLKWYKTPEGVDSVQPCVCPVCSIVCNSLAQYKAHAQGRMHKTHARTWSRLHGGKEVEPMMLDAQKVSPRMALEQKKAHIAAAEAAEKGSDAMDASMSSPCAPTTPSAEPGSPEGEGAVWCTTATLLSARRSFSSYAGSSEVDDADISLDSLPGCSRRPSLLDAVYPVPVHARPDTSVDAATRERLTVLDSILARLTHDASAADANKALSLATSLANSGAAEQVLQSLMDAAVQADEAAAVALVAAAVAEEVAGFPVMLGDAVVELATQGMSTTASEHEEGVFFEAKTRSRHGGLVRFASALVGHDALPACVLLKCVATALEDATAEDVANAYRAVAAVRLGAEEEAEARAMFRGAVKAKYYPGYVKAMVAPLVA
eukprot:TRINITY_DN80_c0_g2_i5.p1 TRINITY_DN80_c0_g2~~TRINITY_DN80_c0_g2_i5.p1  ORF type:complete len:497 (+),score=198.06 TRINITY_DN80_c0_g2_i5:59-1549(+)